MDSKQETVKKQNPNILTAIREKKSRINNRIEQAKVEATYEVLRTYCHEVDIEIQKKFCQVPTMHAINCPYGGRNGGMCDTCDHLVQYSLKNKKAYCLNNAAKI